MLGINTWLFPVVDVGMPTNGVRLALRRVSR
jgi:hypothetical protein